MLPEKETKELLTKLVKKIRDFVKDYRADITKIDSEVVPYLSRIESIASELEKEVDTGSNLDISTYERFVNRIQGMATQANAKGKGVIFDNKDLLLFGTKLTNSIATEFNNLKSEFLERVDKEEREEKAKQQKSEQENQFSKQLEELRSEIQQTKQTANSAEQKASRMETELQTTQRQVAIRDEKLLQLTHVMQSIRILDVSNLPKTLTDNITKALQILDAETTTKNQASNSNYSNSNDKDEDHAVIEEINEDPETKSNYFFEYPKPASSTNSAFKEWKEKNPDLNEQLKLRETVSKARYVAICDLIFLKNKSQPSSQASNGLLQPANDELIKKIDALVWELLSTKRWNESWSTSFEQVIKPLLEEIQNNPQLKKLKDCLLTMQKFTSTYDDKLPNVYEDKDCYNTLATVFQNGSFVPKNAALKSEFLKGPTTSQHNTHTTTIPTQQYN